MHVIQGDISRIQADALVFPTSEAQRKEGHVYQALVKSVRGFAAAYAAATEPFAGRDGYWLPLPLPTKEEAAARGLPLKQPQGVVVGRVVPKSQARATPQSVGAVVEAAIKLALSQVQGEHIVLAIPSLGSGKGAGHDLNRLAVAQVEAAARALAAWRLDGDAPSGGEGAGKGEGAGAVKASAIRSLDVVLVCYDLASRQRFATARADVRAAQGLAWPCWEPPPEALPTLTRLAAMIQAEECVLFIGSGLSSGAGLPSWQRLIERLLQELPAEVQDTYRPRPDEVSEVSKASPWRKLTFDDFLDIASWHRLAWRARAEGGPAAQEMHSHYAHIRALFSDDATAALHPTLSHYLLMSMPWRHIVTTNYDTLIERTLEAQRAPIQLIATDDQIPSAGRRGVTTVVKFHGHASNPGESAQAQDQGIVLTRDEYEGFFEANPAKAMLLEGLLLNHHFLFYGYSLSDQDLRLIYNRVGQVLKHKRREAFSAALGPFHSYQKAFWSERGLNLIDPPGDSTAERAVYLSRWLDALLERAAPALSPFLADATSATAPDPLGEVHRACVALGDALTHAIRSLAALGRAAAAPSVAALEPLLDTLERLGWRPQGPETRARLWSHLADAAPTAVARHRLLQKALAAADSLSALQHIQAKLDHEAAASSLPLNAPQPALDAAAAPSAPLGVSPPHRTNR
jgi:hypothetical protein